MEISELLLVKAIVKQITLCKFVHVCMHVLVVHNNMHHESIFPNGYDTYIHIISIHSEICD